MVLIILLNYGMFFVGDVILCLKFCFCCCMLLCFLFVLILGDGGLEEVEVFVEEGGIKIFVLKLNVFCILVGGVDCILLLVEFKVIVVWRREKGSLGICYNFFE